MTVSRAKQAAIADRRAKMIQMRLAGIDFDTIAERLGYSSRNHATKDLTRTLEANVAAERTAVEALREVETRRLDRLQAAAWSAAIQGDLRAIETVLKVVAQRCKLLGLDAPQRHEVLTLDAVDEQIRLLNAQLAALDREDGAALGTEAAPE